MSEKALIMDSVAVDRALARITHEIIEKNKGLDDVCLIGVKTRGVPLARKLAKNMFKFEDVEVPVGELDITMHRDDLPEEVKNAKATESNIPFDLTDKIAIIVDDVLFTGRTARAAIETVFSFGRPKALQFVAFVDRGHRELPIRADYVGKNLPTSKNEIVKMKIDDIDGETGVYICD